MEPGAVWQDLTMGIRDWNALGMDRADDRPCLGEGRASMFPWAVPGEVKAFRVSDKDGAVAWAAAA
jgi:hypothetical protein